ncbi:hypothetical protein ABIC63_002360 [Pseudacidovorax sp. 1753]|uniref:hypothetical protein n=1 Tax=Pseudacidovorax sp. 1753 TaxID=3156419 RepID=UPI003395E905
MNLFTGEEADAFFGGEVPPAVRHLVDEARSKPREEAAVALWTAVLASPQALPVYYLLYKLHASQGELAQALRAAERGLVAAAEVAGLPSDWRQVRPGMTDFLQPGAARLWLFTLKAQAFILLRRGEPAQAAERLDHLRLLDPDDHMGASVVAQLLAQHDVGVRPTTSGC